MPAAARLPQATNNCANRFVQVLLSEYGDSFRIVFALKFKTYGVAAEPASDAHVRLVRR